jgi:hypothetical protein
MTTDVLKVSGDYLIKTATRGTITLDVRGSAEDGGVVIINGNLSVLGDTTTIESQNATIKDNIIILNSGEPGPGVTLRTAGIRVARGNADSEFVSADLYYDDTVTIQGLTGVWSVGSPSSPTIGRIVRTLGIVAPAGANTLTFLSSYNPNAVLSVKGTNHYEDNVIDPDHIPNKAYVDRLSTGTANYTKKLQVGNTFVEINDNSINPALEYYRSDNRIFAALGTSSNIVFQLEGTAAQFVGLTLANNTIVVNSSTNLVLDAHSQLVRSNSALQVKQTVSIPSETGYTGIYSTSTVGGGGTGLYYVNTDNTDELVSRKRSIIYGIIF